MGVYDLPIKTAGLLAAAYALPGSIFRALGGWLSDKYGARKVMYWTFIASVICTAIMSYPSTDYVVHGIKGDINFNITIVGLTQKSILQQEILTVEPNNPSIIHA